MARSFLSGGRRSDQKKLMVHIDNAMGSINVKMSKWSRDRIAAIEPVHCYACSAWKIVLLKRIPLGGRGTSLACWLKRLSLGLTDMSQCEKNYSLRILRPPAHIHRERSQRFRKHQFISFVGREIVTDGQSRSHCCCALVSINLCRQDRVRNIDRVAQFC
jgi:hypothetical protein